MLTVWIVGLWAPFLSFSVSFNFLEWVFLTLETKESAEHWKGSAEEQTESNAQKLQLSLESWLWVTSSLPFKWLIYKLVTRALDSWFSISAILVMQEAENNCKHRPSVGRCGMRHTTCPEITAVWYGLLLSLHERLQHSPPDPGFHYEVIPVSRGNTWY